MVQRQLKFEAHQPVSLEESFTDPDYLCSLLLLRIFNTAIDLRVFERNTPVKDAEIRFYRAKFDGLDKFCAMVSLVHSSSDSGGFNNAVIGSQYHIKMHDCLLDLVDVILAGVHPEDSFANSSKRKQKTWEDTLKRFTRYRAEYPPFVPEMDRQGEEVENSSDNSLPTFPSATKKIIAIGDAFEDDLERLKF